MRVAILVLAAACQAFAGTRIVDTLYLINGKKAGSGTLTITANVTSGPTRTFVTQPVVVPFTDGSLNVELEPTDTGVPTGGSYSVHYEFTGSRSSNKDEIWLVPTSGSALTVRAVRVLSFPSPGVMVNLAQLLQSGATTGQVPTWSGSAWQPAAPSGGGAVSSVFARTGAVTAQSGDYTTALVTESGNLYFTNARARSAFSAASPVSYDSGTGVISCPACNPVTSVFTRTGAITAQSGDYTTSLVTEGSNLYYTNGRARSAFSATTPVEYDSGTGVISCPTCNPVTSVFTRTGAITAQSGDYTTSLVTEGSNLYFTNARARSALSASAPISYDAGTGLFSCVGATLTLGGCVTNGAQSFGGAKTISADGTAVASHANEVLHLSGGAAIPAPRFIFDSFGGLSAYVSRRANGTPSVPTAVLAGEPLGSRTFEGHTGSAYTGARASIKAVAAEDFTGSASGTELAFSVTPIGSSTMADVWKIDPSGHLLPFATLVKDVGSSSLRARDGWYGLIDTNSLTVPATGWSNSNHAHAAANSGGTLDASAIASGIIGLARGGTNANLSATGGASQVLKQTSTGAAVTVGQLAASDLSDGVVGTGALVKASPTFVTSGNEATPLPNSRQFQDGAGTTVNVLTANKIAIDQNIFDRSLYVLREEWTRGSTTSGSLGSLGWLRGFNSNAPTMSAPASQSNRPGLFKCLTNATIGSDICSIYLGTGIYGVGQTAGWKFQTLVRLDSVSTGKYNFGFGFTNGAVDEHSITASWDFSADTYISLRTCNNFSCTKTATTVAPAAATWYLLTLTMDVAGTAKLQVDAGTPVSHSTNVPASTVVLIPTHVAGNTTTTAAGITMDFTAFQMTGITR